MCQLNLQRPLAGTGTAGKDIQNQRDTVDNLHLQRCFQVTLLQRGQFVVEDNYVVTGLLFLGNQLFQFSLADVMCLCRRGQLLDNLADHAGAGGTGQ